MMITGPNHQEDVVIVSFKTHKVNCTSVKPDKTKIKNRQIHRLEKEVLTHLSLK